MPPMRALPFVVLLAAAACSVAPDARNDENLALGGDDGGARGERADAGVQGSSDAGHDAGADLLGTLSGSCGAIRALVASPAASFESNALVFTAGEVYDKSSLSDDGDRIYDTPNAGGSSVESEVMSFEILRACEGASLLKTETEVTYDVADSGNPSITDLLIAIDGVKLGVNVTRIYRPEEFGGMPDDETKRILEKKLSGILRSTELVRAEDRWQKQILHVFTPSAAATDSVLRVLPSIDATLRADTIVLLTQTTGGGFLYCNDDVALGNECP
jgi:hypothetical protein